MVRMQTCFSANNGDYLVMGQLKYYLSTLSHFILAGIVITISYILIRNQGNSNACIETYERKSNWPQINFPECTKSTDKLNIM